MDIQKKFVGFLVIAFMMMAGISYSQDKTKTTKQTSTKIDQVVEVACGQCQFSLKTQKGCDLAVRINGKAYFVDGTDIDDHGDAHADDGFCNAISKAKVKGEIVKGRFKATEFILLKD